MFDSRTPEPPGPAGIPRRLTVTSLITVITVVAVDLGSKAAIAHNLEPGQRTGLLQPTGNEEFSLGIVGTHSTLMVALMMLGILTAAVWCRRMLREQRISPVAAGLTIGGAVGNTVDRLLHGAVQDFLIAGPAIINLADLAVLFGVTASAYGVARTQVHQNGRHHIERPRQH